MENPNITRKIMSQELGLSQSAIQKHINKLKNAGKIYRKGGDKGGLWIVNNEKE